jgi:hypothetical protein
LFKVVGQGKEKRQGQRLGRTHHHDMTKSRPTPRPLSMW